MMTCLDMLVLSKVQVTEELIAAVLKEIHGNKDELLEMLRDRKRPSAKLPS